MSSGGAGERHSGTVRLCVVEVTEVGVSPIHSTVPQPVRLRGDRQGPDYDGPSGFTAHSEFDLTNLTLGAQSGKFILTHIFDCLPCCWLGVCMFSILLVTAGSFFRQE